MNSALRQERFVQWSLVLLCAGALFALYPTGGRTQAPAVSSHVIKAGDSIQSVAEAVRPQKATMNQMALALIRANPKVFQSRSADRFPVGAALTVPDEAAVLKTSASAAAREFDRFWRGEQHYKAGVALEKSKDMFYAFTSYVEAGKLGHGPAQARLGELYDNDMSGFVKHDLQESMRWYEKARESQVDLRRPGQRGFALPRG